MNDFDKQMTILRQQFSDRCRIRQAELLEALETFDVQSISALAHAIAGSAGTFGFKELSRSAERVEREAAIGGDSLRQSTVVLLKELGCASGGRI